LGSSLRGASVVSPFENRFLISIGIGVNFRILSINNFHNQNNQNFSQLYTFHVRGFDLSQYQLPCRTPLQPATLVESLSLTANQTVKQQSGLMDHHNSLLPKKPQSEM
jgi:hypothetical protein